MKINTDKLFVPKGLNLITIGLCALALFGQAHYGRYADAKRVYDMNLEQIAAAVPEKAIRPAEEVVARIPLPKRKPAYFKKAELEKRGDVLGIFINNLPPQP